MLTLPVEIMAVLGRFAVAFTDRTWQWVPVLVVGAILAPGRRTVTAVLRVVGLSREPQFQLYHRVLNRASWSGLAVSRILFGLVVAAFLVCGAPLVVAADETLERRTGSKITALGAFRDPVRSRKKHTVTSFGLRWVSMMALVRVPWSRRVWALPFLTVLAPAAKPNPAGGAGAKTAPAAGTEADPAGTEATPARKKTKRPHKHRTSVDWVKQMIDCVRRWLPNRPLVLVVDGGLAAVKLGRRCANYRVPVTFVSRLRADACLYDPPPAARRPGQRGPVPKKGPRQPSFAERAQDPATTWWTATVPWYGGGTHTVDLATGTGLWSNGAGELLALRWVLVRDPASRTAPQAFFATDLAVAPAQIVAWFVLRWSVEVTFQETRTHLGVETQRQWSDKAIARTTPALLGLFSVVTLLGHRLLAGRPHPVRTAAWYTKKEATFADTLALVRLHLLTTVQFPDSRPHTRHAEFPASVLQGIVDALCYAA